MSEVKSRNAVRFGRELLILLPLFAVATLGFALVVYPYFGWTTATPMPGRSVLLAGAILLILWLNRESVAAIGLRRPRYVWLAPVLALVFIAFQLLALQPLTDWLRPWFGAAPTDYGIFAHIEGNLPAYLGWLAIAWIAGGFAEEIIFRGYLLNRVSTTAGGGVLAWTLAVIVQAVLFGLGHLYLGAGTALNATVGALARGVFFLVVGRNLWPLILAHGLWDSLAFTLFFLEGTPDAP